MFSPKFVLLISVIFTLPALAQNVRNDYHQTQDEYQFSVSFSFIQPNGNPKASTNYLWVPTNCKKVRAVIITSQNVLEQWINEHPLIRKVCKQNSIAILWSCPGFFIDIKERNKQVNGKNIQTILDSLASVSGYRELSRVPWISIGHSGTNNLVSELVYHYPNRILTAIKMKGGPGFDPPTTTFITNDEIFNVKKYSIPFLCNAGEYFEWNQQKEDLIHPFDTIKNYQSIIKERKQKQQPLTYFFDPNTGHFDCSEALTKLIADYIDLAVKRRLSKISDTLLVPIDLNRGWIAGLPLPGGNLVNPRRYKDANDDEKNLPWYFNRKQAAAAIKLSKVDYSRKPQIAGFANLDGTVAQFNRGIVWPIPYKTEEDGMTFSIKPVFWKAIPDTFSFAGTSLGKSNNHPKVVLLCGNARHVSNNRFTISPERSFKAASTYFIVRTEGDNEYRTSIQPGQLIVAPNETGIKQTIVFDSIINVNSPVEFLVLNATATSGMPVHFYVKKGPAFIRGNKLLFTKIPPATKFPVMVTVVAYQWGRSQYPQIQTAPFVERTFYINK